VTRTGSTAAPLTVDFSVAGTATEGTDFSAIGTSVVIPIGSPSATITLTPLDDALAEAAETIILTLAAGPYTITVPNTGTATITDDDVSDVTPPLPGTVNDGAASDISFQASTTTLAANWSGFSDPESGISAYEWAIGSSPGATDVQPLTSVGLATNASNSSLTLAGGTTYYVTVRALNGTGLATTAASNGVIVDTTPPVAGSVNDGPTSDIDAQNFTWQISANWSGFTDPQSGIAVYEWAIGSSPGATDVQPFTSLGTTSAANGSLSLADATTYFVTVRATNGVGLTTTASSDGVTIDIIPPAFPIILTPDDGTTTDSANGVQFSWTSVSGASGYRFQLADDASFSTGMILDVVADSLDFTSGPLPPATYYARVVAIDAAGNEGAPSPTISFIAAGSSMGSLTVQLGPNSPTPSNQLNNAPNVSMAQIRMTASAVEHIQLSSLRVTAVGTGNDALHIAGVRLFHDVDNDGLLDPDTDQLLADPLTFPTDDGSMAFQNLDQIVPASESRHWIVVASFAGNAPVGSTFALRIALPQDLAIQGLSSGKPLLPSGSFPINASAVTIAAGGSPGSISVLRGNRSPASSFMAAGEQTVEMLQLRMITSSVEDVAVTGLTVHASGSGDDALHIGNVFLAYDANDNGIFNAGDDPVLGAGTYPADNNSIVFAPNTTIPAGTSQAWLVVYDLNGTSAAGTTFTAQVQPLTPGDITAIGATSSAVLTPSGDTFSGATKTVGTPGVDEGELTITSITMAAPGLVPPFAHTVPMAAFELTAGGLEDVVVQQVRLTGTGTGNEAVDISRASLWEDADGDAALTPADTLIAALPSPFAADNGDAVFALARAIPAGESRVWFVSYDMAGWGAAGHTFQVSFYVAANPPPVLASGVASSKSIRPAGALIAGPLVTLSPLVGSSGRKTKALCSAAATGPAAGVFLLALLTLAVLALATPHTASAARRASGSLRT
ncbi:MAG: hypothetical protein HYY16_09920, partial [Planctomycetes bacterium]|nr:hypothetical protein [Planctomycetota bacterium]